MTTTTAMTTRTTMTAKLIDAPVSGARR